MVQGASRGETLVTGGKRLDHGYFYDAHDGPMSIPTAEIAAERDLGPVLVVIGLDDDDDCRADRQQLDLRTGRRGFSADQEPGLAVARRSVPDRSRSRRQLLQRRLHRSGDNKQSASAGEMGVDGWKNSWRARPSPCPCRGWPMRPLEGIPSTRGRDVRVVPSAGAVWPRGRPNCQGEQAGKVTRSAACADPLFASRG